MMRQRLNMDIDRYEYIDVDEMMYNLDAFYEGDQSTREAFKKLFPL